MAAEFLVRWGQVPVRRLAMMAAYRNNAPRYRLRCLAVIRRIGVIADADAFMEIMMLASDQNAEIRNAAAQVIANLRQPQGSESSPQGLANLDGA